LIRLNAIRGNTAQLEFWAKSFPNLCQFDLLQPREFSDYVSKLGLSFILASETINGLWQIGLLHADLIKSTRKLNRVGIEYACTTDNGEYIYCDHRKIKVKRNGWANALKKAAKLPPYVKLYFHPFRYYVLWHLERVLHLNIFPMEFLRDVERYPDLAESVLTSINEVSKSDTFCDSLNKWNDDVATAVICEPCAYSKIFHKIRFRSFLYTHEAHQEALSSYKGLVYPLLAEIGVNEIESKRSDLCRMAEVIDPNREIHTLLRLANADVRLKIKGEIGGAMLLLTMAETLRRATEEAFSVSLPEEDQMGFGKWMRGARKLIYGTERIFDAPEVVRKKFLGSCGLNSAPRFRCYVEGETEYGALDGYFTPESGVELINLKGQFVESKGKGLAFRDSLRQDKQSHILSIVILDGDRDDYVRVVRQAAKLDEMYGQFYIQNPDFELGNFSVAELEEILWNMALERGASSDSRLNLKVALDGVSSGDALIKAAKNSVPELNQLGKGAEWGEALMQFAMNNPNREDSSQKRQIYEIIEIIMRGLSSWYSNTPSEYRVDDQTGKLIERNDDNDGT